MYFERNEKDIKDLLSKGKVFYKFTKSEKRIRNAFEESYYKDYPENSIIKADGYHGLSFCDDISKLINCIGYGDTLTQIIVDKNSPYFDEVEEYLFKEPEEYKRFGEYTTFVAQTGKNYSLSDPSILNALIQNSSKTSLNYMFIFANSNGENLETIYKNLGFDESASFIEKFRDKLFNNDIFPDFRSDDYAAFARKTADNLFDELFGHSKNNFSFEKAELEYENLDIPIDRRREQVRINVHENTLDSRCLWAANYLRANNFSKKQAEAILKILIVSDKTKIQDMSQIIPKFSNDFSEEQFKNIKNLALKHPSTEELIEFIDKIFLERIVVKETLVEKISNKIKEYRTENNNLDIQCAIGNVNFVYNR